MNRLLLSFLFALAMVSCSETYKIDGTTSLTQLEGKMLYLKIYDGSKFADIDSCAVIHGHFTFGGSRDSVEMALVYDNERNLMPVVLDGTSVVVELSTTDKSAKGTVMNDSLYSFIARKATMDEQIEQLNSSLGQRVMNGENVDVVMADLNQRISILDDAIKNSIVTFIKSNYANALGAGMFMLVTMDNPYPVLTPRIEEVYAGAGSYFMGNAYVKRFFSTAEDNMILMREGKRPEQM